METVLLKEAINLFDPRRSLQDGQLDAYYVTRPHAPLAQMKTYLSANDDPQKILFSGHRGSGKSTELRRLARDLEDDFFIVTVSAARTLNVSDLSYVDVVLACAAAILRTAADQYEDLDIAESTLDEVLIWLQKEVTQETIITPGNIESANGKISLLLANLEVKYAREGRTRTTIRERLFTHLSELVEQTNLICKAITDKTGHPPLVIVEDMDKTDLAHAKDLFFGHATTLNSLDCHIIYTFPIPLCYSPEFPERIGDYSKHFLLPNVTIQNMADGAPNENGRFTLRNAITKRVPETLFAPDALDDIIHASGGLMRDLVRLVRDSAVIALTYGLQEITRDMVQQVVSDMANDFRRVLLPNYYETLLKAHENHVIVPDEVGRQLLENLSLLEYQNGTAWCDVHPIVLPLLPKSS